MMVQRTQWIQSQLPLNCVLKKDLELLQKAKPVLLEPIMKLEVVTPEEYIGSVIGDLNRRRGLPKGQEQRTGGAVAISSRCTIV